VDFAARALSRLQTRGKDVESDSLITKSPSMRHFVDTSGSRIYDVGCGSLAGVFPSSDLTVARHFSALCDY